MKAQINFRASTLTATQLEQLMEWWGTSQTETITILVDRAYQAQHQRRVLIESVADKISRDILDEEDMRRINTGEGWTYDVGDDQHWTRHEGARLTEAEMAEALRLAAEWAAE